MYKTNYEPGNENIRIVNPKQAAFYYGNGLSPVDIYPGKNNEGEYILIFVFSKKATQDMGLYEEWCERKHELKIRSDDDKNVIQTEKVYNDGVSDVYPIGI